MGKSVTASSQDMERFLREDLRDALTGLFVGAVSWEAHPEQSDQRGVRGLAMFTSLVQARALYEFFFEHAPSPPMIGGNASAFQFAPSWVPKDARSLYAHYMGKGAPAQKRVFHLVYGRSGYSGGSAPDESDHLKNQVRELTRDIRDLTSEFALDLHPPFRGLVENALQRALETARDVARGYGIALPELA